MLLIPREGKNNSSQERINFIFFLQNFYICREGPGSIVAYFYYNFIPAKKKKAD